MNAETIYWAEVKRVEEERRQDARRMARADLASAACLVAFMAIVIIFSLAA